MYETFSQVRPSSSESKPNLLTRICGQPPLFSPEHQLLNWLVGVMVVLVFLFAAENAIIGVPLVAPDVAGGLFYLGLYYLGRFRRAPVKLIGNVVFGANLLLLTLAWLANDGIDGSSFFLYLATLVGIMSVFRGRWRFAWTCAMFAHVAAMIGLQYLYPAWVMPYISPAAQRIDMAFTFFTVAVFMMGYVGVNVYNLDERTRVADELLVNILPHVVAKKLKYAPAQVIAEYRADTSILFADIVSFTPLSAGLVPIELVKLLNSVFSYFDTLTDKYGVEKIKTIGDCYMVAAGVPTERVNHAEVLTRLALEMREYVSSHDFQGKRLSLRIGINSGAVVAGVIGYRKFAYDLWGDAVNTASRMESHGQPNVIQITGSTYELIKEAFVCQPQGCIDVKGKGEMPVWHVVAARA